MPTVSYTWKTMKLAIIGVNLGMFTFLDVIVDKLRKNNYFGLNVDQFKPNL
jgi:hypothetical protein